jgi:hypothetical protein
MEIMRRLAFPAAFSVAVYGSVAVAVFVAQPAVEGNVLPSGLLAAAIASLGLVLLLVRTRIPVEPALVIVVLAAAYVLVMVIPVAHAASCWDCRDGEGTRGGAAVLTAVAAWSYIFVMSAVLGILTAVLLTAIRAIAQVFE